MKLNALNMKKYRVKKGNKEFLFRNVRDLAEFLGVHYVEVATEFGLRKKQSAYINGYYIERVKKQTTKNQKL